MSSRHSMVLVAISIATVLTACRSDSTPTGTGSTSFSSNPCSPNGTVQLDPAQAVLLDCSAGGTTVTLAGNGASYLIVPQFPTDLVANEFVSYTLSTGNLAASVASAQRVAALRSTASNVWSGAPGSLPPMRPKQRQAAFESAIFARARRSAAPSISLVPRALEMTPPTLGSTQNFQVLSNLTASTWTTVTAQLAYVGTNVLLYIDTNAPANGFTAAQLTAFGQLFDQTLYGIDVSAFGQPSDIDQNGHVIMLLSPVVNADTPASACAAQGYVAGFFDPNDFSASDPNSNHGEIFYSVVPDPTGSVSCSHTVADLGLDSPATFLHELQHLINYSQHVVVNHGAAESSWLDEGMSIAAEELGSAYYEAKCPAPACRTDPLQLFPDSSQGFVNGFLYDSYSYALLPDTASVTLHSDSDNGFSWRGGDWALVRYLGDHFGTGIYQTLEQGPADGISNITAATGESFTNVFANFGLALYADSFPGLPRATAPATDRFLSRNLRQLWARLYVTSSSSKIPLAMPLTLAPITTDTSTFVMYPGTMSFWRLDTPASDATVSIRFSSPGGNPFSPPLQAQIAIFRLPSGQ